MEMKRPARMQAWPGELARPDGAADVELQLVPATEVAHRGDAGREVPAGVAQHFERHRPIGRFLEAAVGFAPAGEMDVTIDQAGDDVLAAEVQIDNVLFEGGLPLVRRAGIDDLPIAHADRCIRQWRVGRCRR